MCLNIEEESYDCLTAVFADGSDKDFIITDRYVDGEASKVDQNAEYPLDQQIFKDVEVEGSDEVTQEE